MMTVSSDSCAKIKALGFRASMQIKMYGERFEIVSDPFTEGDCIAVRATSGRNPEVRTVLLPIAILRGIADRFLKRSSQTGRRDLIEIGRLGGATPRQPEGECASAVVSDKPSLGKNG